MKFFNIKKWLVLGLILWFSSHTFAQRGVFQSFNGMMNTKQLHYLKTATENVLENGYQLVMLDISQLKEGMPINLNLKEDLVIEALPYDITKRFGGKIIWKGNSQDRAGDVKFIINGDLVTGGIRLHEARYRMLPLTGGLHVLIDQASARPKKCAHEHRPPTQNDAKPKEVQQYIDEEAENDQAEHQHQEGIVSMAAECKIRLLVAYTNEADAASADILSVIETDNDDFNAINANSNVDFEVELVRVIKTSDYTEVSTSSPDPLGNPWNNSDNTNRFWNPNDGFMDYIHDYRNQYDADMCHLYCTNLAGFGGEAMGINVTAANAFCSSLWNNGSFTPTHEWGHLIGMRHNPENDPTTTPYAYGHGYHNDNDVAGANFRTVMSYNDNCNGSCPVIPNWSNPSVNYMSNPTGTSAVSDNARVARERDVAVSGFQSFINTKNLLYNDTIDNYETVDLIAKTTISTNNKTVIFESGSKGTFRTQDKITLKSGFHGKAGCVFKGQLEMECTPLNLGGNGSTNSFADTNTENEVEQGKLNLTNTDTKFQTSLAVYPNPFDVVTNIKYTVGTSGRTELALYDIFGKKLQVLQSANLESGEYQYVLNASHLSAGTFYCVLENEGERQVQKIVVIK